MRKLAREAVIFMLFGLMLSFTSSFIFMCRQQANSIRAERDSLKKHCDSIPSWGVGEQGLSDEHSTTQAECSLVFGTVLYPPRSYDPGVRLSQATIQDDSYALAEGERIRNLSIDYQGNVLLSCLAGAYGFVAGLGIWLFYRLIRFAVKG